MVTIREATPQDDAIIARHFYQLWRDNDVPGELIKPNWLDTTLHFIAQARHDLSFNAFIAEVDDRVVGSASCQLFAGLYPLILLEEHRQYGYIWGVYVEPPDRGRGIATALTEAAIAYLKALHCTRILLHASPAGKPVYTGLGFINSSEMRLDV